MRNAVYKDRARRLSVFWTEQQRLLYRAILQDRNLPHSLRYAFILKLNTLPRNSISVRVRNRCVLTGRSRGIIRHFKCSRISLRELVSGGQVPGLTKSSW